MIFLKNLPLQIKTVFLRYIIIVFVLFSSQGYADHLRLVTEQLPPFNYINEQGFPDGLVTKIVQQLLSNENLTNKIELMPWARAYKIAQSENNVLIFSIIKNKQREADFEWLNVQVPVEMTMYGVKQNSNELLPNQKVVIDDINKIHNQRIGVLRKGSYAEKLTQLVDKSNIISKTTRYEQLIHMLEHDRVDYIICPKLLFEFYMAKPSIRLSQKVISVVPIPASSSDDLYIAFSKHSDPELVMKFRLALVKMKQSGEIDKIKLKFYRDHHIKNIH